MKKSDIIQLVKETVAERRKRYGQHDYYGNNVGGRNSISGMPGVWEEELMGSGLEIRQLADSFTLDELEQLYRDKKISNTDYNGAVNYLQAWINQHPTYLPQRDLSEPKRQKIRDKYLNEEVEILDDVEGIENLTINISEEDEMAPKEMAQRIKDVFDMVNGTRNPVQTPEFWKNFFKSRYGIPFPEKLKNIVHNIKLKSNIVEQNVFSIGLIILKIINNLDENDLIIINRK